MHIKELIVDTNGSLSHTKLWANIGNAVISYAFTNEALTRGITPELIISYGVIIGGYRLTSKYLDMKGQMINGTGITSNTITPEGNN